MSKRKKSTRSKARQPGNARRRDGENREWIGGLLSPPFFVTDRDEPYRPGLVVWIDARDGLVVGQNVVVPEEMNGAVGRALLDAIERPLAGPPGRPDRIRVADASLAEEVRAVLGDLPPVEIEIAPTPEFDELLQTMIESIQESGGDENESYLEEGRVPPATLARFFSAAQILYQIAPWRVATDDQLLRMDIPELGVEGACVSIIGNLGESLGLLIFPSLDGYEAFCQASDDFTTGSFGPVDLGSGWLALSYERGADLPTRMRREVVDHGWPVADANAYPRIDRRERDGASRPLVERDIEILTACISSFTAFFAKHQDLFEEEDFEPVCESYFDQDDLELIVTMPYEAFALFDLDLDPSPSHQPPPTKKISRNAPCPCGSGKKYKKCHASADEAARRAGGRTPTRNTGAKDHDLDMQLVHDLSDFAMRRFGFEWRDFTKDFVDASEVLQLSMPWSVYHYLVQGQTILDHYVDQHARELSRPKRQWLVGQKASWLSTWEVIEVEAGVSLTLLDLLSYEKRRVREASASRTLVVRDVLLGRIIDHQGESLLCGTHPNPLPPVEAAEVVRRARGRLRRKRAVPVERLREEAFGRYLIKRWEEAVEALEDRLATPPELHNTDGDPLLLTTDHFDFAPDARVEILARLDGMENVDAEEQEEHSDAEYIFLEPGNRIHTSWETTVVGRASLSGKALRIETNSVERADALRARIEAACADLIRHRAREHMDPTSTAITDDHAITADAADASDSRSTADSPPPPEMAQLLLDFKRRHYADWPDQSLPALDGLTPREALATAQGRNAVDVLLKDMENHEQRSSGSDGFDFGELRRELGLE